MATFTRTLQQKNWLIYAALLLALAALLALAPAEARLGNVVKIVYAHGAAERIAVYAYLLAGGLGIVYLAARAFIAARLPIANRQSLLSTWTRAVAEIALLFWLAQIVISAPAQILAWGAFTLTEPRVASALVVLVATALVYAVARWLGDPTWFALAAIANAVILIVVLRGALNILHPVDPIVGSDSPTIKIFYAAIVVVMGLLAAQLARDRVGRI